MVVGEVTGHGMQTAPHWLPVVLPSSFMRRGLEAYTLLWFGVCSYLLDFDRKGLRIAS